MLSYSVVIPTRRSPSHLDDVLASLSRQTHPASSIYIVLDIDLDHHGFAAYEILSTQYQLPQIQIITHLSHPSFYPGQGVSNVRNYGLSLVQTPAVLCIDDDNAFEPDFCHTLTHLRGQLTHQYPHIALLCPTEKKGNSDTILSQGFAYYNYLLARPQQCLIPTGQRHHIVNLIGSNCLRGDTNTMKKVSFDNNFPFVAEDLDYTQTITDIGHTIIVTADVSVYHLQRPKNSLQLAYVGDPASAYQKGKNRILFVHKHGKRRQQRLARRIGIPGNTIRLSSKIICSRHHTRRHKKKILTAFRQGTRDGRRQGLSVSQHDHSYT